MINSNAPIIVEYYETIIRTANGGVTWTKQASGTTEPIKAVYLKDKSNGWAVGDEIMRDWLLSSSRIILNISNGKLEQITKSVRHF